MNIWQELAQLNETNQPGALCIIIRAEGSTPRHTGSKMIVFSDGRVSGSIGGGELESRVIAEALASLSDGQPRRLDYTMSDPQRGDPGVCGGRVEIYVEPIFPKATLVVVGAGHVGQAVAHLAKWLGFYVVVSDDRPELCTPETIPDADQFILGPLAELTGHLTVTPDTCFVLTTRSVDVDVPGLPALLATPAGYIGVIGSRRRWQTTTQQLLEVGVSSDDIARVHSPMGLAISAETPEEIAISILAQIIQIRRTKEPGLKNVSGSIN